MMWECVVLGANIWFWWYTIVEVRYKYVGEPHRDYTEIYDKCETW